jgi:hypothetical protein
MTLIAILPVFQMPCYATASYTFMNATLEHPAAFSRGLVFFIYTIMSYQRLMPSYVLQYRFQQPSV